MDETVLLGIANQVVKKVRCYDVDREEAFQVAYLAGLQALRSAAKRKRQTPEGCDLFRRMRQALIRYAKSLRQEAVRENGKSKLPIDRTAKPESSAQPDQGDVASIVEAKDFLETHLSRLTDKQQEAIQLVYYEGLSMTAAAKELGLKSRDGIHKRLKAAIEKLRELGDEK